MDKKFVVFCVIFTIAVAAAASFFVKGQSGAGANTTSFVNEAQAKAPTKEFDWGKIDYGGGNVTATFQIENPASEVLKLRNVRTSCHCTQARVILEGDASPYFGMSTISGWIGEVRPGEKAQLEVVFDPDYHGPGGVGPINRFVEIETSDQNNKKLEFSVKGVVVK